MLLAMHSRRISKSVIYREFENLKLFEMLGNLMGTDTSNTEQEDEDLNMQDLAMLG